MSIETVTPDEFMRLTQEEVQEALDVFDESISKTMTNAASLEEDFDRFADDRDKLGRLLTLRKVFQGRWDELEEGPEPAPRLASTQYLENERNPALVS